MIRWRLRRRRHALSEAVELAGLLPSPGDPVLHTTRQRVLKEHLLAEITGPAATPVARPGRRMLTAAVPVAVVLAIGAGMSAERVLDGGPAAVSVAEHREARVLLDRVAAVAAERPVTPARDGQYVYIKFKGAKELFADWLPQPRGTVVQREDWHSVDGTRRGLARFRVPPAADDAVHPMEMALDADPNAMTYRELAALPTDPKALLRKLYTDTEGQGPTHEEAVFEAIASMLPASALLPDLNAALYYAAADLPHTVVVPHTRDAIGRKGIGLTYQGSRHDTTWVFDALRLTYLGTTASAVMEVGISETLGQAPVTAAVPARSVGVRRL